MELLPNGFTLDTTNTFGFTLCFLRANTTANCGKGRGFCDYLICTLEITFFDLVDEFGDVNVNGAAGNARHMLATEATECFVDSNLFGITGGNFKEITGANLGLLSGHGVLGKRHIGCHITGPPS